MKIIIITQHAFDHACKHTTTASLSKTGISSWVDVHITIRKGNHCILTLKYKNDIVFLGIFPCNSYSIGLYLFHRQTSQSAELTWMRCQNSGGFSFPDIVLYQRTRIDHKWPFHLHQLVQYLFNSICIFKPRTNSNGTCFRRKSSLLIKTIYAIHHKSCSRYPSSYDRRHKCPRSHDEFTSP